MKQIEEEIAKEKEIVQEKQNKVEEKKKHLHLKLI